MLTGPAKSTLLKRGQQPRDVDVALAQGREVGDAPAAALVLQVEVAEARQRERDVVRRVGSRVVDDVARVVVETDARVADLLEDADSDLGSRQQVRVRLDAEADAALFGLGRDRPDVLLERPYLVRRLGISRERVQHLDAELAARAQHVAKPGHALLGVELRMAAHRDRTEPVPLEQPARVGDDVVRDRVRVEVLEEALDRADLDVLEARLREAAQRLFEV